MDTDDLDGLNEVTQKVIGCAYCVSNALGSGFLEKVYENALAVEMRKSNLPFTQQQSIDIFYNRVLVGEYVADFVVANSILLELKAAKTIDEVHQAQLMNYLKATQLRIGLILNFGTPRLGIKRMML